jgi:hypothetical protein
MQTKASLGAWAFAVLCALSSGCAPMVVSLDPLYTPVPVPTAAQRVGSIRVAPLELEPGRQEEAQRWQRGLPAALEGTGLFRTVVAASGSGEAADFVLRGRVRGDFLPGGLKNFLTWFPGPFIFAPNWRGNHFVYETHAELELVDARSQRVVARYEESLHHALIHKSGNPVGHLLGAAIIAPGVVRGILNVRPRRRYRSLIYEQAYADLWDQLGARLVTDLVPYYAERLGER